MDYRACGQDIRRLRVTQGFRQEDLAEKLGVDLLAQIPLVASICDGGDQGKPAALQNTVSGEAFNTLAQRVVEAVDKRNRELPPTHKVDVSKR